MSNLTRTTADALDRTLAGLKLPPILATDTLAAGAREMLMEGPEVSLRRGGALFYDDNGGPLDLKPREAVKRIEEIRTSPGGMVSSTMRMPSRVLVSVSTAYMGVDLSLFGVLPLVWETLVFVGDREPRVLNPFRYATRAAAHAGHKAVVAAIPSRVVRER